jgi:hypothetical protein
MWFRMRLASTLEKEIKVAKHFKIGWEKLDRRMSQNE